MRASTGTWKSLNTTRPESAISWRIESKSAASVVSLYGVHSANVRKSRKAAITSEPELRV